MRVSTPIAWCLGIAAALTSTSCLLTPVGTDEHLALRAGLPITSFGGTDLLLVVDNSASMADKQRLLAKSLQVTLSTVVCTDETGKLVYSHGRSTPVGGRQCHYFGSGVRIGLITTDLATGAEGCRANAERAHLVPLPSGGLFVDEGDVGLEADTEQFVEDVGSWVTSVGEKGCGYEAPLESAYRFLVDPAPRVLPVADAGVAPSLANAELDQVLLEQRRAFIRPDAALIVVFLTDEDDCSVLDSGPGFRMGDYDNMPRATSICDNEPNSACCRSCGVEESPPTDCAPLSSDDNCMKGPVDLVDNHPNVRCLDQKARFGTEMVFPVERYVQGFTQLTIADRAGNLVRNPLFSGGKTPDLLHLALIAGVPWQLLDVGSSASDPLNLDLLASSELETAGVWDKLIGPTPDPHLVSSIDPRPGLAGPTSGAWADPIHGHDFDNPHRASLQYSCAFPLPEARDCATLNCDCAPTAWPEGGTGRLSPNNPVCQQPDGSYGEQQDATAAFPPPRLLQVLREVGGTLGPICPKALTETEGTTGFAYTAVFSELLPWMGTGSPAGVCLAETLPAVGSDLDSCRLLERLPVGASCDRPGRREAGYKDQLKMVPPGGKLDDYTVCEVIPAAGDQEVEGTPAYSCAHDEIVTPGTLGYCYIDVGQGLGDPVLVQTCPEGQRRRVRVVPADLGLVNDELREQALRLVCYE